MMMPLKSTYSLQRYLVEFDFRYNNRVRLEVADRNSASRHHGEKTFVPGLVRRPRMNAHDPQLLNTGLFTVPEAAFLVQAPQREVRVWVEGRKGKSLQAPIIENQVGRLGKTVAISFTNLMELRFVSEFSKAGIRLSEIRAVMEEVRDSINHPHPFATKIVFRTDGRKIIAQIARKNGVKVLYDLRTKNYEMLVVVLRSLKENVVWDPKGEAIAWYPRPQTAPHVIIHPSHSFGRPILKHSLIPTETVAAAVKAEGSLKRVSELYEVPERQVREAVSFEEHLRQAA
jgi:uncharacterized protein (DUF433 family)